MHRFVSALPKSPPFLSVLKRNLNQVNIKTPGRPCQLDVNHKSILSSKDLLPKPCGKLNDFDSQTSLEQHVFLKYLQNVNQNNNNKSPCLQDFFQLDC